jgi:hypothetical protein
MILVIAFSALRAASSSRRNINQPHAREADCIEASPRAPRDLSNMRPPRNVLDMIWILEADPGSARELRASSEVVRTPRNASNIA